MLLRVFCSRGEEGEESLRLGSAVVSEPMAAREGDENLAIGFRGFEYRWPRLYSCRRRMGEASS